ncbi:MAG: hypothetical protein AB9869_32765 [Verrucomicrobiia bacterium]
MKTTPLEQKPKLVRGPHARNRTLALVAGLAIGGWSAVSLHAAVIDDMCPPKKCFVYPGESNQLKTELVDCQLVFSGQFPGAFDPSDPLRNYDHVHWSLATPTLDGHTLDTRVDLVRTSSDDVMFGFGVGGTTGGYGVFAGPKEVWLLKFSELDGTLSLLFAEDAQVQNENLRIGLAVTQTGKTNLIAVRLVDKSSSRVLFAKEFPDGPGRDALAPAVPPKGLTDFFGPDPGATHTKFEYAAVLLWQFAAVAPPPLEVVLDNLEYDVYDNPALEIEKSILLSWPENTAEEQIVVGADSLAGPWTPWPEPCFKRHGQVCTAVPITFAQQWTQPEQYFKLVPGAQFIDDFGGAVEPWVPDYGDSANASKWVVTNVNQALRIQMLPGPVDRLFVLFPPGPDVVVSDFSASVDILACEHIGWLVSGIAARGWRDPGGVGVGADGCVGYISLDPDVKGKGSINIYKGQGQYADDTWFYLKSGAKYRLCFSGVGTQLSLRLYDLSNLRQPIAQMQVNDSRLSQGFVSLHAHGTPLSYSITLDNFFVTGAKPSE